MAITTAYAGMRKPHGDFVYQVAWELRKSYNEQTPINIDGEEVLLGHWRDIEVGDMYVAGRNTGPHLFIAREINLDGGWITPEGPGYPFDMGECYSLQI